MTKRDDYAKELGRSPERMAFLRQHSGLPGPRGNLKLVQAAADVGREDEFREWIAVRSGGDPTDEFRTLRQALAYCWSVVVVADPERGKPRMEYWAGSGDPDVRWVIKENLKKARLLRLDPDWVEMLSG